MLTRMPRARRISAFVVAAFLGSVSPSLSENHAPRIEREMIRAFLEGDTDLVLKRAQDLEILALERDPSLPRSIIQTLGLLAEVHFRFGNVNDTIRLYRQAVGAASREGSETSFDGLTVRHELGSTLNAVQNYKEAAQVFRLLLADLDALGDTESDMLTGTLVKLGVAERALGNRQASFDATQRAVDIAEAIPGAVESQHFARDSMALHHIHYQAVEAALPLLRENTKSAAIVYADQPDEVVTALHNYAALLHLTGHVESARNAAAELLKFAKDQYPLTHPNVVKSVNLLLTIERTAGNAISASVLLQDYVAGDSSSAPPEDRLNMLKRRAEGEFARLQIDAYFTTLMETVTLLQTNLDLPRAELGAALIRIGVAEITLRGDFDAAYPHFVQARAILGAHAGPDHIETLRMEAEWINARRLEAETFGSWRATGRRPVFWNGTAEDARYTEADAEIYRRLAEATAVEESRIAATTAAQNYASVLRDLGRTDAAVAVIREQLAILDEEARTGSQRPIRQDALLYEGMGSAYLGAGRNAEAIATFREGLGSMLETLRGGRAAEILGSGKIFTAYGQLYGQNYARAAWIAREAGDVADKAGLIEDAFIAMQLAGFGPASTSVFRASIRRAARDPELAEMIMRWEVATSFAAGNPDAGSEREIAELQTKILARVPDFLDQQVPAPLPVSALTGDADTQPLLGENEAAILILPNLQDSEESGGFVIAVTREGTGWAQLPYGWDMFARDILSLHDTLDPGRIGVMASATRAPASAIAGTASTRHARLDIGPAKRLYRAIFDQPEIRELIASKHNWTLIPMGEAMSIPFNALIMNDPGPLLRPNASSLREVKWLGLEKALQVAPSVAALAQLRMQEPRSAAPSLTYVGIGDPDFRGGADAGLFSVDSVLRGGASEKRANLSALPRLPGTRREVERLARLFGAAEYTVLLGSSATEGRLRELDDAGHLKDANVVHFATHGLLTGSFDGLAEPALALTPGDPDDPREDGLFMASEAAQLRLDADWVILSACDTAGRQGLSGDGLGGLVQGFFNAGARNLMVSHWRVEDRAAERLATETLELSARGIPKAEALRRAMRELAADSTRDDAVLTNAHPSVWAPFLLVGGG